MKAHEIAYIITLIQADTKEKKELVAELQKVYQTAQGRKYGDMFRVPIIPELTVYCD